MCCCCWAYFLCCFFISFICCCWIRHAIIIQLRHCKQFWLLLLLCLSGCMLCAFCCWCQSRTLKFVCDRRKEKQNAARNYAWTLELRVVFVVFRKLFRFFFFFFFTFLTNNFAKSSKHALSALSFAASNIKLFNWNTQISLNIFFYKNIANIVFSPYKRLLSARA